MYFVSHFFLASNFLLLAAQLFFDILWVYFSNVFQAIPWKFITFARPARTGSRTLQLERESLKHDEFRWHTVCCVIFTSCHSSYLLITIFLSSSSSSSLASSLRASYTFFANNCQKKLSFSSQLLSNLNLFFPLLVHFIFSHHLIFIFISFHTLSLLLVKQKEKVLRTLK